MVVWIHYGWANGWAEGHGEKRWWSRAVHPMPAGRGDEEHDYEHMPGVVGFFPFHLLHADPLPTLRLSLPFPC